MIKTLVLVTITVIAAGLSIAWVYDTISYIRWDESHHLTWDDFRGIPNPLSPYGAIIKTPIKYQISYDSKMVQGSCHYWFTKVEGIAYMSKVESFVKEHAKTGYNLNHEQGHFDLAHIYAKEFTARARAELLNNEFLCPDNDPGKINNAANRKAKIIFNQVSNELQSIQSSYDAETNHGLNYDGQKKWDSIRMKLLN